MQAVHITSLPPHKNYSCKHATSWNKLSVFIALYHPNDLIADCIPCTFLFRFPAPINVYMTIYMPAHSSSVSLLQLIRSNKHTSRTSFYYSSQPSCDYNSHFHQPEQGVRRPSLAAVSISAAVLVIPSNFCCWFQNLKVRHPLSASFFSFVVAFHVQAFPKNQHILCFFSSLLCLVLDDLPPLINVHHLVGSKGDEFRGSKMHENYSNGRQGQRRQWRSQMPLRPVEV
jgi:hypothetical protein